MSLFKFILLFLSGSTLWMAGCSQYRPSAKAAALDSLRQESEEISAFPQWPLEGRITSYFGKRISPQSGRPQHHQGLDIAAPLGSPILAAEDGVVVFVGSQRGYGRSLILDHGHGLATLYAHASKIFLKSGEKAKRGQLVASVGRSGAATGPHLHYEVHVQGIPADPIRLALIQWPRAPAVHGFSSFF